jgi:hypothetical protein
MDKEFLQMFFIERKILPKGGDMQACIRVVFCLLNALSPAEISTGQITFCWPPRK